MRRRPTPMAPDDTITTWWPAARRLHAVSTMSDRIERSGWWVFSSTIEDVPACVGQASSSFRRRVCTVWYLPSFMTTVSWPGCLRMWTAMAAVGVGVEVAADGERYKDN